ncbi:MAG TPA: SusC/RagA family TonB-linked outer membrane protein [Butyricimonas virosa]|uniref:SusC/RagA family TonB-linked outer membrane protein n=1 Tax=Butyricimonas virosa TaxID=544645 RepID=A0A413IRN0_9BACT|nr:SusC/RagA family TonB-linked outer membrane protein [Butyricimonas virosa]MCI7389810.1 SusC/RagA family TonB-linked outer membrane protein [Butyricimonas virosa]MDY4904662.1 SusC/RagA family TonB-linked outer membrane protein [Butyricimonas virosa]MDY5011448.1 SusC/RagA family TonB-linked outer membrane protein [Butyricimonas virosa]MDY5535575.1 SusC/RagA family TonB-linked outer membrane protein [Butyricimonas virosa]RGL84475.1 SusC/RagA family TonB-linked outer membrane protein [Butyricim
MAILLSKKRSIDRNVSRRIVKMFLIQFVFCLCFFTSIASGVTQNRVVNLDFENVELSKALKSLSEAANCKFVFNYDDLNNYKVSAKLENKSVEECLDILLARVPFKYSQEGELIVISYKSNDEKKIYKVRGVVKDETGMPLPGVAVIQKGTTLGAATDVDGRFEFQLTEKNVTLVFSFVGMKTKELLYDGSDKLLDVTMEEEVEMLGEVVATGYQTISRERSTGSVTILKAEDLRKVQGTSLVSKIEGLTPGLSTYGDKLEMRGTSSFAVSSTPLLVVDGIVMNQGLNSINPDDVETITVLKDAAATSLYGVRASNGVIVITTKKGKSDKVNFDLSAGFYINPLPKLSYMDYASTSDIIDFELEFLLNNDLYKQNPGDYFDDKNQTTSSKPYTRIERYYYELYKGNMTQAQVDEKVNAMRKNDYRKEARKLMSETALTQNYNLSISKGGEKSNLYFSLRYEDNGKYLKSDAASQYSIYLKNELNLTDWFTLTYGANTYIAKMKESMSGISYLDVMPYEKVLTDEGNPVYQYGYNFYRSIEIDETEGLEFMGFNLNEERNNNMQKTNSLYVRLFTDADFKLWKGLDLGVKFQYERKNINIKQFDEADSYKMRELVNRYTSGSVGNFVYNLPQGGHLSENNQNEEYFNFRAQLNYQTTMGEKHDLTVLAGAEIRQDEWNGTMSERYGYDDKKLTYKQVDWATLAQGVVGQLSSASLTFSERLQVTSTKHRYVSAYANAGYTYDSKYSLNASVRVEQADLFGTDPKYRYRPLWSVGAGWLMTRESFLNDIAWLDMLKLRVTYGITGNVDQSSSPYLLGAYITSPYTQNSLTSILTPPNPMLRWEKTSTLNIGTDFALLGRLKGSLEFYRRYSSDLLANKTLDPSLGFESARVNNGAMRNTGLEISLSYDWLNNKEWALNTTLTAANNKNKIMKVGFTPSNALDMLRYPGSNYLKGDTYNSIYAYRYAGLTENGDPSVYDENGEIKANEPVRNINALVNVGQLTPKWNGALAVNLRWKTWEFFTKFVYYTGHSLRNDVTPLYSTYGSLQSTSTYGSINGAMHKDMVNRWTESNKDTDIPAMRSATSADSDRENLWRYADSHVLSASFIKCRNIGVSYSFPKNLLQKINLQNVVIRAQVDNPFYWAANDEGIDPESFNANEGTRTQFMMPTYSVGLNINF